MRVLLFTLSIFFFFNTNAQIAPVDVAERTIKIGAVSGEDLYYGFAEGDEIIFSFEELKGKPLKEIEITELPTNSKFSDFKASSIVNKRIKVSKTSVYKFSFWNSAIAGRICKIKIQRIPKSEESIDFSTDWKWKKLYDTSYVAYTEDSIVGYDTTYIPYTVKEVLSVDTNIIEKYKNERIHTYLNSNGDRSVLSFNLPQKVITKYRTETPVSWAYWFGTEGAQPQVDHILSAAELTMSISPVAGLAIGLWGLVQMSSGKNLDYLIMTSQVNANLFLAKSADTRGSDSGDGSSVSNQVTSWYPKTLYFGFDNDYAVPVDVNVRVSIVVVTKIYEDKLYQKEKVTSRKVTLNKKKMELKESKVRVNVK
jgi:hypothetical protein